jgi:hypothetical protein
MQRKAPAEARRYDFSNVSVALRISAGNNSDG